MTSVAVARAIGAPVHIVFDAVSNFEHLPSTSPDIVRIDFFSESRTGAGTRFMETRRMGRKEVETELEVTEFVPNERVRLVADSHGTVWDTLYTLRDASDGTELRLRMEARPYEILPRMINPLMKGFYKRGMAKYLRDLGRHCEGLSHGLG